MCVLLACILVLYIDSNKQHVVGGVSEMPSHHPYSLALPGLLVVVVDLSLSARCVRPSSIRATVTRCTSSGPSASRSVLAVM